MTSIQEILKELDLQERKAKDLSSQVSQIINAIKSNDLPSLVPDLIGNLSEAKTEFVKLTHRSAVLQRAIEEAKGPSMESKNNILEDLIGIFLTSVQTAFPQVGNNFEAKNFPLTVSTRTHFGDYQCNIAMSITKALKGKGISVAPKDVAAKIKDCLPANSIISNVEIANPGYLNIWLSEDYLRDKLVKILTVGPEPPAVKKERVVVDFSSPNIAKEMHVGHLRSTIIGDSICRLLEFLGHDVVRLNHVGDWGTQFGMLIAHLQDKFPDYLKVSPPIADLQSFYKESKTRFDADEKFKARAYSCVVRLQSGDPDYIKAWTLICDVSRKEFQIIYDRLGVVLKERGESFYQKMMEALVKELNEKGFLEEDEGRKVMFGPNKADIPLTIVKSDGGFTYDTSDMACIKHRIEQEKADRIIYVTDSGQGTHFKVLFSCAKHCGILDTSKVRVDHVGFGLVLGEDKKKFKTRSGETIRLCDLLDEGLKRCEQKLLEKERDKHLTKEEFQRAKEAVAYGCIKYADLCHNRINDYVFSFDKMLEDKGNTAVYLLYNNTRIRSIARNAGVSPEEIRAFAKESFTFSHEKEWKLVKMLLRFPEIMLSIVEDLLLHRLCEYLYDVAGAFSEFYDNCFCIERDSNGTVKKIHMERLLLCEATSTVMEKGFDILGLTPVHKM